MRRKSLYSRQNGKQFKFIFSTCLKFSDIWIHFAHGYVNDTVWNDGLDLKMT